MSVKTKLNKFLPEKQSEFFLVFFVFQMVPFLITLVVLGGFRARNRIIHRFPGSREATPFPLFLAEDKHVESTENDSSIYIGLYTLLWSCD